MANYQTYKKINGTEAILQNSVGPGQVTGVSTGVAHQCVVWNNNHWSNNNGGCCLYWTVPSLTTTVRFEITAGGGSGSPGICCGNGPVGGSGAYAVRTLHSYKGDFTAGSTAYTVCSGGTNRCSCCGFNGGFNCCGFRGCTSYVSGSGLSNFCVEGGSWGWHQCSGGCYSCTIPRQCQTCLNQCSCPKGCDFGIPGVAGARHNVQYCRTDAYGYSAANGAPLSSGGHMGNDNCTGAHHGCCKGHGLFPGGGGFSPFTTGSCCWGGWGGSGLVVINYWQ